MNKQPPTVLVIALPPMDHLTFSHEAPDGTLRAWDVTWGNAIAEDGHPIPNIGISSRLLRYDLGMDPAKL